MTKEIKYIVLLGILILSFLGSCVKDPTLPILSTTNGTNIKIDEVTSGGIITKDGGAPIVARGICWGTSPNPTIDGAHTIDDKGTGSFTSLISALTPNTLYYLRAYATNSVGTAYGNEISFTTKPILLASLSTTAISSITISTAISGGTITLDGGGEITSRGICWATTINPSVADEKTTNGPGSGTFTASISGLQPGTIYFVRSYAVNSAGTSYGDVVSFTTIQLSGATLSTTVVSSITKTTATTGGNISSDGGAVVTARGVCYATTANPSISNDKTTDATGTGIFSSNLSALQPGTTYYVKAYATNSVGTTYGNEVSFTTSPIVVATLATNVITSITSTTAVSGGNITDDGGGAITARGICWATTTNPTIDNEKTSNATGSGTFTSNLSGLLPGTHYFVRSYATNSAGTTYGNEIAFTTNSIALATLTTNAVTSITSVTATSGGNITSAGGGTITVRGICWSTSTGPTTTNFKTLNGNGTGSFTGNITNLLPGTTYFVRAYATNEAGPSYGNEFSFTTHVIAPTITTTQPTNIAVNSATSGGTIVSNGGGSIVSGICWATTTYPTTGDFKTTDGTGTGSYVSNLSSLQAGSTYYVRAYATNSAGTSYGVQFSFNTKIADIDGNTYTTVKIGNQIWMAEDLKTTRFNNGSAIPIETDNTTWSTLATSAYCWYDNNITYKNTYGALYNWYTASSVNLCPTGWHVPTDAEYNALEIYLGMPPEQADVWGWRLSTIGDKMKNTTGWTAGQNGTNTSGFSALPGGYRHGSSGLFSAIGQITYWWSSTPDIPEPGTDIERGWYRRIDGTSTDIYKASTTKAGGKFVRCLKN